MLTILSQNPNTATRLLALGLLAFLPALLHWLLAAAFGRSLRLSATRFENKVNVTLIGVALGFVLYLTVLS